jgi:hypothetical protein
MATTHYRSTCYAGCTGTFQRHWHEHSESATAGSRISVISESALIVIRIAGRIRVV